MRPISPEHKEVINEHKYYKSCALKDNSCAGRITIEHVLIYAGRQIAELWNYLPLCEYHHSVGKFQDGGALDKEKNTWITLNRADDEDLIKYSKCVDYIKLRERLNNKYGSYKY